jgi:hypothetical protein
MRVALAEKLEKFLQLEGTGGKKVSIGMFDHIFLSSCYCHIRALSS